jgi:outer membrane receptor protein involved in Fe transport
MKKFFLTIVAAFTALAGFAQGNGRIIGVVMDEKSKQPVEFATVALTDAEGKTVNGTIADAKGKFEIDKIANGTYTVTISFIGYETITKSDLVLDGRRAEINLGTVSITEEATQLGEVVVEAQRVVVEEKVDRTVYNAENDKTVAGGDASDVLRRVPLLSVDMDGNVSMRGNSNLMVLINNKPSTISAGSVADALKQIPADQIKSVEVITSPSAKYDAEGSAGIINIITKKNNLQGATLNVDAGVGLRGSNLGLNGSYRRGKMGFNLGGFGRAGYNVRGNFENEQFIRSLDANNNVLSTLLSKQSSSTRRNDLNGRYTLGWDYDINPKNYMAASIRYGLRNGNNYQDNLIRETYSESYNPANLLSRTINNSKSVDNSGTIDASLDFTHIFDKAPHEISFSTQFSRNNRNNNFRNTFFNADGSLDSLVNNDNYNYNQEVTFQTDYQRPIGTNQNLEVGAKNITRSVYSDFSYFGGGSDGVLIPIDRTSLNNSLNYNQNVSAAYLSYTLSSKNGYSLKAGGRYEYTIIDASYREGSELPDPEIPSYGTFVPSVNASRKLKNGNTLKASYNRRIQRPSIRFLNPNIQASNPLNISVGNPDLDPEFTNNYELGYSTAIKGTSLNFSAFVRNTTGSIQSIRQPLAGDTILTTYDNIGREDAYGGSIFANVNIGQKLTLNGSTDIFYAVLDNKLTDPLFAASNEGWVVSGRMFGSYKISKRWTAYKALVSTGAAE